VPPDGRRHLGPRLRGSQLVLDLRLASPANGWTQHARMPAAAMRTES
jgi:hypothetical protein